MGKPSTKGFSGVGPKFLILGHNERVQPLCHILKLGMGYPPLGDVVGDVVADSLRVVTDDEACVR